MSRQPTDTDIDTEFDDNELPVSKSQRKRDSHALQAMGERLVRLSAHQLTQVPLPEELLRAVAEARRIKAHGGRRRQLQYIGKLMRHMDPEPIRAALEAIDNTSHAAVAEMHRLEHWRERLLAEGDSALGELADQHPALDRQLLRNLVRRAMAEREAAKPPKAYREIFRYLKELLAS